MIMVGNFTRKCNRPMTMIINERPSWDMPCYIYHEWLTRWFEVLPFESILHMCMIMLMANQMCCVECVVLWYLPKLTTKGHDVALGGGGFAVSRGFGSRQTTRLCHEPDVRHMIKLAIIAPLLYEALLWAILGSRQTFAG
jgi:hypothetical protein